MNINERKKVLVVDDNEDLCDIFQYHFTAHGFEVFVAGTGHQALKVLEKEDLDVIVSDIRMPDGDGLELLEHLRRKYLQDEFPAFVLMSGFTEGIAEIACEMGASAVLEKPFEFNDVLDHIDGARLPLLKKWDTRRKLWHTKATQKIKIQISEASFLSQSQYFRIGKHGFFIATNEKIVPDTIVEFEVNFEDKTLEGTGFIKWSRAHPTHEGLPGVGIRILELKDSCRTEVASYLNTHQPSDFIPRK